jgi:hypothetical protein
MFTSPQLSLVAFRIVRARVCEFKALHVRRFLYMAPHQQIVVGWEPFYLEIEDVGSHRVGKGIRSYQACSLQDDSRLSYVSLIGSQRIAF